MTEVAEITEEKKKRERGPNKNPSPQEEIAMLKEEVALLRKCIIAMSHYNGNDAVLRSCGIDDKDLYKPGRKEMSKHA